jgi:hypothetical protein
MLILISIIEAVYVIYMLNYFKTKYSLAPPLSYFKIQYLRHPIGVSAKPHTNICPFGHDISWLIAAALIIRSVLINTKCYKKETIQFIKYATIILAIGSLVNLNCLLYLLPVFIIEYYLYTMKYRV